MANADHAMEGGGPINEGRGARAGAAAPVSVISYFLNSVDYFE